MPFSTNIVLFSIVTLIITLSFSPFSTFAGGGGDGGGGGGGSYSGGGHMGPGKGPNAQGGFDDTGGYAADVGGNSVGQSSSDGGSTGPASSAAAPTQTTVTTVPLPPTMTVVPTTRPTTIPQVTLPTTMTVVPTSRPTTVAVPATTQQQTTPTTQPSRSRLGYELSVTPTSFSYFSPTLGISVDDSIDASLGRSFAPTDAPTSVGSAFGPVGFGFFSSDTGVSASDAGVSSTGFDPSSLGFSGFSAGSLEGSAGGIGSGFGAPDASSASSFGNDTSPQSGAIGGGFSGYEGQASAGPSAGFDPSSLGFSGFSAGSLGGTAQGVGTGFGVTDASSASSFANDSRFAVTNDPAVMGRMLSPVSLADVPGPMSFGVFGRNENAPVSVAGYVGIAPTSVTTTSVNPNDVSTNNIGVTAEPTGPANSFTDSANPTNANISLESVVSFTGNSQRGVTTVSFNGQEATISPATPAHMAAMGYLSLSQEDVSALGKTIAGEVPSSIVGKIANGVELSRAEMEEVAVVVNVAINRAFANTQALFGPFNGSVKSAVEAGFTSKNAGQFSAYNDNSIGRTEANYGLNPAAFDAIAESFVDGTATEDTNLSTTAAAATASHYFNPDVAEPDWGAALSATESFGTAPHSHFAGRLGNEYSISGQVPGIDSVTAAAYSAVTDAAQTGFVGPAGLDTNNDGDQSSANTVDRFTYDSAASSGKQQANVIMGFIDAFARLFSGSETTPEKAAAYTELPQNAEYIPVFVQINETEGTVYLSKEPIETVPQEELETADASETSEDPYIALQIDEDGSILYSDGTYAPATDGAGEQNSASKYVYVIERIKNGELVTASINEDALPGNFITHTVARVFSDTSPFRLSDVEMVTYEYIDADTSSTGDEYYEYIIKLKDGSSREAVLPVATSLSFYKDRLAEIGYQGDVFALTSLGVEVTGSDDAEQTPGIVERLANSVQGAANRLTSLFTGDQNNGSYTDFGEARPSSNQFTGIKEITALTVYVGVPVVCPGIGEVPSYIYRLDFIGETVDGVEKQGTIAHPRCGSGGPRTYVAEIVGHLESEEGLTGLNIDQLLELAEFEFAPLDFEFTLLDSTQNPADEDQTNIVFEAKTTNAAGDTVIDWTSGTITVERDEQIHFRWDASAYSRCLPFIGDNGHYSLQRGGSLAMTTGNTEQEGYDVFERTGTYRIECGSRVNGEEGVDEASIEVQVR